MAFTGQLRPFQKEAHDRIIDRNTMLLALPMGTGKTVTSLAAIESLMDSGVITEPGIILAGASLKYQWESEIAKFTNSRSVVVSGTPAQRRKIYEDFWNWDTTGIDYLIVTYETMSNDANYFAQLPRGFVIADEVVALKGFRAKRTQRAKKLFRKTPVKIGLSGTPIENGKPEELFSIMEFLDPTVLGRFDMFDRTFIERNAKGWVEGYKNLGTLHRAMQPAMVRRSYDDPEISEALPTEIVRDPLLIDLDPRTASLMRRITRDLKADLVTLSNTPGGQTFSLSDHYGHSDTPNSQWSEADVLRGLLMSKIVTARMLCDHPDLVRHSAYLYGQEDGGSAYAAQLVEAGHLDMVTASPKLDVLAERLEDILSGSDSKVVVFSVFRGMLDLIQRRMSSVGSVVYHGGMNAEKRNEAKIQFQTDPDTRLFISSDAGGYGVDLPQANALINYDLPWAAGALDQRNARPRRVSSTWEHIVIENLMIKDSLEEWQFGLLAHKTAVSQAILAGRGITESGGVSVPLDSLLTHLSRTDAVSNR